MEAEKFWNGKRVLVTGAAGFVGSHLAEQLVMFGANLVATDYLVRGKEENLSQIQDHIEFIRGDLMDMKFCEELCQGVDAVFHLAARVSGIEYNVAHPATMLNDNIALSTNMIEAAHRANVDRYLCVSSPIVYPLDAPVPTPEDAGMAGEPEGAHLGYAWAKRVSEVQARAYHKQYGMKVGIVRPYNIYGPRDDFSVETGHVIPALIVKVANADDSITVLGDGSQMRSFIHVQDVALGMMAVLERYCVAKPVNLATREEISIGELAATIVRLVGRDVTIEFDRSAPMGAPRRMADPTRLETEVGYTPQVNLEQGLADTVRWYLQTR